MGHPKLTPPSRAKMRCNVHVVASASSVARAHIVGHSLSPFLFLAFSFSLSLSLSPSFFLPLPSSKITVIDHQTVSVIDHRTVSVINQHHQYHCATRPCSNLGAVMRLSRASRLHKILRWVSHGYKHLENHHKAALCLSGQLDTLSRSHIEGSIHGHCGKREKLYTLNILGPWGQKPSRGKKQQNANWSTTLVFSEASRGGSISQKTTCFLAFSVFAHQHVYHWENYMFRSDLVLLER